MIMVGDADRLSNVIPLRAGKDNHAGAAREEKRGAILTAMNCDVADLATSLGSHEEWVSSAVVHLKNASSDPAIDAVTVSKAALHLVLMRLEELERWP